MKTADGYVVKTSDIYPVVGKDTSDYNYPLTSIISTPKTYMAVMDP
jgi:hypothetical protein